MTETTCSALITPHCCSAGCLPDHSDRVVTPPCFEGHVLNRDILFYYYPCIPNMSKQEKKNGTWTAVLVRQSGVGILVSRNPTTKRRACPARTPPRCWEPQRTPPSPGHAVASAPDTQAGSRQKHVHIFTRTSNRRTS